MDYQNLKLRFTTWQTYAFLFSILGLLSQHYGWLDFQKIRILSGHYFCPRFISRMVDNTREPKTE